MKNAFLKSLTGVTATMLLANFAGAQTTPEVEPNETKAPATPATLVNVGDTLTGTTTGTSTTVAGNGSADFFRVKTAPAALGIYRHRLALTTTGSAGHAGAIMGLPAAGTPSDATTTQTSTSASTPARMNQWYGFGKEEEIYYRVTGTTSTTGGYVATYDRTPITPVNCGSIAAGSVTVSTYGQGHTSDTELFLYDSNFNLLNLNDDGPSPLTGFMSQLTSSLTPGTYYVAIGRFNTATQAAQNAGDRSTTAARLDFANAMTVSSSTTSVNVGFTINDALGAHPFAATSTTYEAIWGTFTVVNASTPPTGTMGASPASVQAGNSTLLTVTVTPGANPASTGITVTTDLTNIGGGPGTTMYDDGTNGDVTIGDNIFSLSYTVPGATTGGVKSLPFSISDAQARSSSGSGSVTVIAPPAATDIGTLVNGNNTAPTLPVAAAQVQWYKFTLASNISRVGGSWLDITSSGTLGGGTFTNDTIMAVYRADGTVVASDDDDGPDALSSLTFGLNTPTRANGNGIANDGRDGAESMTAGTYYLVVSGYNCAYAANFSATGSSNSTGSVGATLYVGPAPSSPTVSGTNVGGGVGDTVLIRGTVVPGLLPTSTGLAVVADLSLVGGSPTQALNDAGTDGDVTAGDNIFSYAYTLPALAPAAYNVALSVSDAQARSGAGSLTVNVDTEGAFVASAATFTGSSYSGSIGYGNDVDMLRVNICDPATFSATVSGGTLADSQLFLFRADGTGVAFNDDTATALSAIDGPIVQALTAGTYYLAITDYNTDAHDAANALIWANSPFTGVRAPDGPGAANALSSWDTGGGDTGTYTITFVGGGGDTCPTCPGNECGSQDYNGDGDFGTDADIEAFFACLGGNCCATCFCQGSDFNGDGDFGTDADIEAFFRVLAGGNC